MNNSNYYGSLGDDAELPEGTDEELKALVDSHIAKKITLPPSGYRSLIMEACSCTAGESVLIEDVIRELYPTLDHLTAEEIKEEAKIAQKALKNDPELRHLTIAWLGFDPTV